jgi:hypothetical protein
VLRAFSTLPNCACIAESGNDRGEPIVTLCPHNPKYELGAGSRRELKGKNDTVAVRDTPECDAK